MRFLLDSSTCVAHLRGRSPRVSERIEIHGPDLAVCSIVVAELVFCVHRSRSPTTERTRLDRFLDGLPSLPFDDAAAEHAAGIRSGLAAAGTPIGPYDLLIAATAVAHKLIVVSSNAAEFERVDGLMVEDWV